MGPTPTSLFTFISLLFTFLSHFYLHFSPTEHPTGNRAAAARHRSARGTVGAASTPSSSSSSPSFHRGAVLQRYIRALADSICDRKKYQHRSKWREKELCKYQNAPRHCSSSLYVLFFSPSSSSQRSRGAKKYTWNIKK